MKRFAVVAVVVAALVLAPTFVLAASPRIVPPAASPQGHSYGEWGAAWWQWAASQPSATNPVLDTTGDHCTNGQSGRVWFLAGTMGGSAVERDCTVPPGTMLFFPVVNAVVFAEPGTLDEAVLRDAAAEMMDDATDLEASVDGIPVDSLETYRVQSPLFAVTVPDDNLFEAPAGTYEAITDGVYLMLSPLLPGTHTIHFAGEFPTYGVSVEVTYTLTVGH